MISDQEYQQLSHRMEDLEKHVKFLYHRLNIEYMLNATPDDDPRIIEFLRQGKRNEAVSLYRQLTGADLRIAMETVDEIKKQHGF